MRTAKVFKSGNSGLRVKLRQVPVDQAGIPVVSYGELVYGAFKSARRKEDLHTIGVGEFVDAFEPRPL